MIISGIFLPNLLVTNPKKMFPIMPPTQMSDATQDASFIVILPDGSGVSSDINRSIDGELQPHVKPTHFDFSTIDLY